jgi:Ca-activated chloride channel family protein
VPFELRSPVGLALLGLLVPLVLLYVLRIKREERRVSSIWLWQAAARDLLARQPFRRLVPHVSLILEALALVALALSVATPLTRGGRIDSDHVAVVIDGSASMTTLDASGRSRAALAQEAARAALRRLGPGADALVIEAGREPRVVSPWEHDVRRLEAAVDRVKAGEVEGDLGRALSLASSHLRARSGTRRILVFTDGAFPDRDALSHSAYPLEVVPVGTPADNVAIVRVDIGRAPGPSGKDQVQAFALVQNFGKQTRSLFVTLSQRGVTTPLSSRRLDLAAGEQAPVVLAFDAAAHDEGMGLVVELAPGDALRADDRAYVRVPESRRLPVVLAPKNASPWLARALGSDPDSDVFMTELAGLASADVPRDAFVVVDGACPKALPGADFLIVNPPAGRCVTAEVRGSLERPSITSWAEGDPRLRFASFDGVSIARASLLEPDSPNASLVRAREGTLIADISLAGRSGTLVAFDVGESTWPLRASFVLFVRNQLELARAHRAGAASGPAHTGDPLAVRVPLDVTEVELERPDGTRLRVPAHGGLAAAPGPERAGLYYATWKGQRPGSTLVPVNLTSAAESDLRPRELVLPKDRPANVRSPAALADAVSDWSWLLAALGLTLAAADVFWVTRGVRRAPTPRRWLAFPAALACVPPVLAALAAMGLGVVPQIRLERPWLALPAAAVVLAALFRLRRSSPRQGRVRRVLTEACAALLLLLAGFAVPGLELGRPLDRLSILVALDRSRSIDLVPNADTRIATELRIAELGMREEDRIGVLAFGTQAAMEDPLRPRSRLPAPQRAELGRDGTDLGAAIRHALGEIPPDSSARIVLLSDGVATRGDAIGAALAAVAAGVPVDAVPLDQSKVPDVRVTAVRVAPRASEGEPLELRVVTSSSSAAKVEVRVLRDGEPIRSGEVSIAAGEDVLHLRELAPAPGFHRYDVELSARDPAQDLAHEDNDASAFVRVRGQASALVLDRDPGLTAALVRALEAAAFRVDVRGPTAVPADVAGFAAYDLVTLSDIPASDLAPSQIDAIASYVRDLGGGLLLFGGERGLGPGGFGRTPIEDVSPVSFDVKQERRRASLAEVIAVDYSGSMSMSVGSRTKLELANEAAVRSAELLGGGDRLGVMHVDTVVSWTVPLGPVVDRTAIAGLIRAVKPGGGGIFVDLALGTAYDALYREKVQLKHCLLFSDGADAEEHQTAVSLATRAKANGITTSVVALGNGSDVPDLEDISRAGAGRFYLIEDANRLPAVFAQETVLASRSAINEVTFRPALGSPGPAVRGIDFGTAPPLTGYVVTVPKTRAQVHLTGPEGDPILATWSAGVGRTAVFTSDFKDRWGQAWTGWDAAGRLFGQVARDVARRADDPRVRLEADAQGGVLHLRANVVDERGRAETFRRLRATVAGPDGFSRTVELAAVGTGAYAAEVPLERPGSYVATAIDETKGTPAGIAGATLSAGEELRPTGTDRALLTRIAELSNGKLRDTLAGIFEDRPGRRFAYQSLTQLLLLLSTFGVLAMVTARRLALPKAVTELPERWRTRRAERAARAERRARSRDEAAEKEASGNTLEALRQAKSRSRAERPGAEGRPPPMVTEGRPAPATLPTPPGAPHLAAPRESVPPSVPPTRPRSAAEILLAKRKRRQR